jgi:hypothetical protein
LLGVGQLALQLAALLDQRLDARRHVAGLDLQRRGGDLQRSSCSSRWRGRLAGQRLDAAHAGRDRALAHDA